MRQRGALLGLLIIFVIGLLATALPAGASVEGRRNTAAVITGAAVSELLRGNTGTGIALGLGAAIAWDRVNDAKRDRDRYRYYDRYGYDGYYNPYYDPYYQGRRSCDYDRDSRYHDRDRYYDREYRYRDRDCGTWDRKSAKERAKWERERERDRWERERERW